MKNFFNAIGVASMEKIHSAMIAWILDDKNDKNIVKEQSEESLFATFPIEVRSEILCQMFGIEYKRPFESIQTHVEWNDIDIMISGNFELNIWYSKGESSETDVMKKKIGKL